MLILLRKLPKYLLLFFLLIAVVLITIIHVLGNFYQVDSGVYRSGQLNKYNLEYYVKEHNIKTIINLRGKSERPVYLDEINISKQYRITHIDYPISNRKFLNIEKTSEMVKILREAQKPMLIHCAGGADRTSLAAALYQFAIAKKSVSVAKEQFSFIYGHTPFFRKHVIAMDNSFDNYTNKVSSTISIKTEE